MRTVDHSFTSANDLSEMRPMQLEKHCDRINPAMEIGKMYTCFYGRRKRGLLHEKGARLWIPRPESNRNRKVTNSCIKFEYLLISQVWLGDEIKNRCEAMNITRMFPFLDC